MLATSILLLALATTHNRTVQHVTRTTRKEVCPGALYFYSGNKPPYWTRSAKLVCVIGDHKFYAPLPKPKKKEMRHGEEARVHRGR